MSSENGWVGMEAPVNGAQLAQEGSHPPRKGSKRFALFFSRALFSFEKVNPRAILAEQKEGFVSRQGL